MNAEAVAVLRTTEDVPVPLAGVRATGRLNGLLFELEVEQRYENRSRTNIEALYTFPVPLHAAFLGLEIEIGARRLIARAKRTDQARREYEDAIDEGNTAVLLERADDGLYTVSLGNLLADETAVIRYRYAELLDVTQGAARLRIPTVIAPRYGDPGRRVQPHQVPGVDLAADYPFELKVIIEGLLAEAPLSSPTHEIRSTREGAAVIVTLEDGARLDRDFVLTGELGTFNGASVTARDLSGGADRRGGAGESEPPAVPGWRHESGRVGETGGYVSLVSWVPVLPAPEDTPLSLKVLIDCSGSMSGDSIAQARRALAAIVDRLHASDHPAARRDAGSATLSPWQRVIERLNSVLPRSGGSPGVGCGGRIERDDRGSGCIGVPRVPDSIALTRFGSRVDRITAGLEPVTPGLMLRLRDVAQRLQSDLGGTELPGALRDVLSQPTNGAANPAVLLITDGEIWAIDQALAAVAASGHRLFVVAVGAAPNEALARRVAEVTGGACEFVTPGEDTERTIVNMARRVREPGFRVSDVRWPIAPRWTAPLPPAVFSGDTVHLLAGFDVQPEGVAIVSVSDGRGELVQMQPVAVSSTVAAGDGLARLAAARRLAALSANEAATLAERYQLASKWTAFVVVDEREAKAASLPEHAAVPQMLAAGWGGVGSVRMAEECDPGLVKLDCSMEHEDVCYRVPPVAAQDRALPERARFDESSRLRHRAEFESDRYTAAENIPGESSAARVSGRGSVSRRPRERADTEERARLDHPRRAMPAVSGEVGEALLDAIVKGRAPWTVEDLARLGVPQALREDLLAVAAAHHADETVVIQIWAGLLLDRLAERLADPEPLKAPTVRAFVSILGDRTHRDLRRDLARVVRTYSDQSWTRASPAHGTGATAMHRRIRHILNNLDTLREDLLALSDDIWLDIDHNDSAAVERGMKFKIAFNNANLDFSTAASKLSQLIETFIAAKPEEGSATLQQPVEGGPDHRERTIRALDRQTPHTLAEDFRYKRPIGFICGAVPFDGTTTWSQVYETLCRHLASVEPAVFEALPSNLDFVSDRNNRYFSRSSSDLRIPRDFGDGVLAETNLSANQIRDLIRKILKTFGVSEKDFTVYLREDRDAGADSLM